jgi:hypothetical protein
MRKYTVAVRTTHRWILYLIALVGAFAALTWSGKQDGERSAAVAVPAPAAVPAPREERATQTATGLPSEIQLDNLSLARRLPAPRGEEPFPARTRAPRVAPAAAAPAPAAPASQPLPEAPPLPFTYGGKVTAGSTTLTVLSRQDRIYFVRVGDVLDGIYRVEAIGERRLVLQYLPLGIAQVLPVPESSAPPSPQQFVGVAGPVLVPWHPDHDE